MSRLYKPIVQSKENPDGLAGNLDVVKITGENVILDVPLRNSIPLSFFDSCLVDHSGRQFACKHQQCNYEPTCFMHEMPNSGIDFHELKFNQEDREIWYNQVFPDILRVIQSIDISGISEYRFIFNHRYIRKDGTISQFMHEGLIDFTQGNNIPNFRHNAFTEIGNFKTDESVVLSVFRYSDLIGFQKIFGKVYGEEVNCFLSPREIEVVRFCLKGLSSKMIAENLNLSIHTVKNHKRNCMEKTMTHNIAELIHFCIRNRWV